MEMLRLCSLLMFVLCTDYVSSFDFWNATNRSVELPSHFTIDTENQVIIVAAKNSICHVSFDLQNQFNVITAEPEVDAQSSCIDSFKGEEACQNYHHVLTLPYGQDTIYSRNGTLYNINDTVLACGSNAFSPMCQYRHRETLDVLRVVPGVGFCPYEYHPGITSIWTSTSRLVTAAPVDLQGMDFGISVSDSPYSGEVSVTTKFSDRYWFHNTLRSVSMYEIGEFVYLFFLEEALETTENVIYSRVARVCKNDPGSQLLAENSQANLFTTFVKARISCSSGTGTPGDIPFHFNEIQDTFFVPSGSGSMGEPEHLYAVFTSARNGPVGSAVCVFTFGTSNDDIGNVFNGEYLRRKTDGSGIWETVDNYDNDNTNNPFTCDPDSRSISHARDIQLMKSTVTSSNGPHPLLVSEEYSFDRIVVSQVVGLDNETYDIMLIAAHSSDKLVLIKATRLPNQPYHVIQTIELGPSSAISQMKVHGTGSETHIYLGTDNGIYGIPVADCSSYTDCCSCLNARDPYCGFDTSSHTCVSVVPSNRGSLNLVQDVANGNSSLCPGMVTDSVPTTTNTMTSSTETTTEEVTMETSDTVPIVNPTQGLNVGPGNSTKLEDHTWTIVGSVVSFVGGVIVGIIITAFFFRKTNLLLYRKNRSRQRRRRRDLEESGNERKNIHSNKVSRTHSGGASNTSKHDDFRKNNNIKMAFPNDYTSVYPMNSSQGERANFSKKCDSPAPETCVRNTPIPVPPPTPPFKKTQSTSFSFEATPQTTPQYRTLTTPVHSDPNMKSELRTEEPITNQQRAAYGRNILARAPSIDASKNSKYSKTTLPVVAPHIRFGTHPEFVHVQGMEVGSSQC